MKDKTFDIFINTCIIIAIILIVIVMAAFAHAIFHPVNNTQYVIEAKIINIDTFTDTVQIEDSHGEVWEFFGTENFQKGDSVIVLMDNQKTSTIYDDEILSVRLDPVAD